MPLSRLVEKIISRLATVTHFSVFVSVERIVTRRAHDQCGQSGAPKCPSPLHRLTQRAPIALSLVPRLVKPIATRTREGRGHPAPRTVGHAGRHPVRPARDCPVPLSSPAKSPLPRGKSGGEGAAQRATARLIPVAERGGGAPLCLIKRRCQLAGALQAGALAPCERSSSARVRRRSAAQSERSGDRARSCTGYANTILSD